MQDDPNKTLVLSGVAKFLMAQVLPAIDDRGLAFRVRIAAHLVGTVAREVATEGVADRAELAALVALGFAQTAVEPGAMREAIVAGRGALATLLRRGEVPEGTDVLLAQSLAARLSVSNPRFSLDLETGEDEWDS